MKNIKDIIKKTPIIYKPIRALKNIFSNKHSKPSYWIEKILDNPTAMIIQIGSNDGCYGDPVREVILKKDRWKALFVEPVPYLYKRLCENYGKRERFQFANVAINEGVDANFYWVNPSAKQHIKDLPPWYDQLGSFNREHITKHLGGVLEPYIEKMIIKGITLSELFSSRGITNIDLLHIDTEGYDWKILSQIDLKKYNPAIIIYEHIHLSDIEKESSLKHLGNSYNMYYVGNDIISISNSIAKDKSSFLKKFRNQKINV